MPDKQRKNLRLQCYDYTTEGAYFLTFCTANRLQYLSHVQWDTTANAPYVQLLPYGEIAEAVVRILPERFPGITLLEYAIMPDHIHLLLLLPKGDQTDSRPMLSKIMGYIKMNISKQIHQTNPELEVWQRGYYDHIIRNYEDLIGCAEYIQANAYRWLERNQ